MDSLETLIEEFRTGDYARFPLFYEETHRKVYYISYGLLSSEDDAKDVMQETYVRFISSLERFEKGSNPYAYLATIARNLSYDHLKRNGRDTPYEEGLVETSTLDRHDGMDEVERLLAPLNKDEREIVILHVLDELKFREIAEITRKKLSTVLVTYHRAIKKMKEKESTR